MNTKFLSDKALEIIDQYTNFRIHDSETCNIPYFNNNHKVIRAGLRATIGKGSPGDIFEEVEIELAKNGELHGELHSDLPHGAIKNGTFVPNAITSESLKHFLVDRNIGIDCSGFTTSTSLISKRKRLPKSIKAAFSAGPAGVLKTRRAGSALPPMPSGCTCNDALPSAMLGQISSMCAPSTNLFPGCKW